MRTLRWIFIILSICTVSASLAGQDQDANFQNSIYLKLAAGDYAYLEEKYAILLKSHLDGKISEEDLSLKFKIFSNSPGLESNFDHWVQSYPKSYSARLARALFRISAAWEVRGIKFSNETTDEQINRFKGELREAAYDLDASLKLYSRPIGSYTALMKVSLGLGSETHYRRQLLIDALEIDPQAFLPRKAYQYSLTPKWGGNVQSLEDFLKECKKSSMTAKDKERIQAYHHLYLGENALFAKQYKQASDQYFMAYQLDFDPNSILNSGQSALDGSLYDLAFQRFNTLVKMHPKNPYGYNKRGWIYEIHFKNDEKSFDDYLTAADLGDSYAQNRVGWWYMTGRFVSKDYTKAEVYLKRAAEQKNETAIVNLKNLEALRNASSGSQK
jgi:Sel1 repeat/Domain of unknown function (DUF4034)